MLWQTIILTYVEKRLSKAEIRQEVRCDPRRPPRSASLRSELNLITKLGFERGNHLIAVLQEQ